MKKAALMILLAVTGSLFSEEPIPFNVKMMYYYEYQFPDIVELTIDYLNSESSLEDKWAHKLIAFYIALFENDSTVRSKVKNSIDRISSNRYVIQRSLDKTPSDYLDQFPPSPTKNDLFWSMFFATGDGEYLNYLIKNIPLYENRKDLNLFMTGSTAIWSLSANSKQHEAVSEYIGSIKTESEYVGHWLNQILELDIGDFRENVVTIIKNQKELGIW